MDQVPFREFIKTQLKLARINKEYRDKLTTPECMKLFLAAVTHPSVEPEHENNYQELEFIGDGIIKGILSQYIPRRWPGLLKKFPPKPSKKEKKGKSGEGILSKVRRYLEQRKTLSEFALQRGFWSYVRADEETLQKKRKETLEDVFEAFTGALVEVVDTHVKRGLGYNYAYNYVTASLDELELEITKELLDDAITLLNELYKANDLKNNKPPLKWGDAMYLTEELYIPIMNNYPTNAKTGNIIFYEPKKLPQVFVNGKWRHPNSIPLVQLVPYKVTPEPTLNEFGKPENHQMLWYAGVYGFPSVAGKDLSQKINTIPRKKILSNPDQYSAEIIGQGINFTIKEAKKMAASQALTHMKGLGYETL